MRAVIADQLQSLAVPMNCVELDPTNANRGDVPAVQRSLTVFGQRKPIVAKRTGKDADGGSTGIVIAGNHTLMAARELGWDHIAVVFTDDDATTAKAYALADNRTGELSTWDTDQLAKDLAELSDRGFEMPVLGWSAEELVALLAGAEVPDFAEEPEQPQLDQRAAMLCPKCAFEWRVGARGEIEPV